MLKILWLAKKLERAENSFEQLKIIIKDFLASTIRVDHSAVHKLKLGLCSLNCVYHPSPLKFFTFKNDDLH